MADTWDVWQAVLEAEPGTLRGLIGPGDELPEPAGSDGTSWVTALAGGAHAAAYARHRNPKERRKTDHHRPARRLEVLAFLVERGQAIDGTDDRGRSALELAAAGDAGLTAALLELGADFSAANPAAWEPGRTPLHAAAAAGNLASVEALLAAGADATTPDGHGRTPAVAAYRAGHDEIVDRLAAAGAHPDPATPGLLHAAVVRGDAGLVERCLAADPHQVNAHEPPSIWRGSLHATPLTLAAMHGRGEILVRLIEAGADADPEGASAPLQLAVEAGGLSAIGALLAAGADPHRKHGNGFGSQEQVAHAAARFGHVEILRRLLDAGVKPMVRDEQKATLLHAAAMGLRPACVELLLERGADATRQGGLLDRTPLKDARDKDVEPDTFSRANGFENAAERKKTDKAETIRLLKEAEKSKPEPAKKPTVKKTPRVPAAWRSAPFELPAPALPGPVPAEAVALAEAAFGESEPWPGPGGEHALRFVGGAYGHEAWVLANHDGLRALGCRAVSVAARPAFHEPGGLLLLPSPDLADAIAMLQTNGVNSGVGPGHLAAAMEELRAIRPCVVTALGHDRVDAVFTKPTRSTRALARFVADLCPDAGQTPSEVASLAVQLKETGRLLLWWD